MLKSGWRIHYQNTASSGWQLKVLGICCFRSWIQRSWEPTAWITVAEFHVVFRHIFQVDSREQKIKELQGQKCSLIKIIKQWIRVQKVRVSTCQRVWFRDRCVSTMAIVAGKRIPSKWGWMDVSQRPPLYCRYCSLWFSPRWLAPSPPWWMNIIYAFWHLPLLP